MNKIRDFNSILVTLALFLSIGATVLIAKNYKYYHYWSNNRVGFLYCFEMTAAISICYFYRNKMANNNECSTSIQNDLLMIPVLIAFIAGFIGYFGMKQFGGYDMSLMIDAGWRVYQGQIPYSDFVCTLPPSFYLGLKYAYSFFGVKWSSIIILDCISSAITTVWIYVLLRLSGFGWLNTSLLTLLAHATTTMLTSFWWYNPFLSINICLLYLTSRLFIKNSTVPLTISLILSMLLILLGKPNGWISLPVFAITFLPDRKRLVYYFGGLCASLILMNLILWAENINPIAMFNSYRSISGSRGIQNPVNNIILSGNIRIDNIMFYSIFLYLFIMAVAGNIKTMKLSTNPEHKRLRFQNVLLNSALFLVVFALFNTNVDIKNMDLLPIMLSVVLTEIVDLHHCSYLFRKNRGSTGQDKKHTFLNLQKDVVFSWFRLFTIQLCILFYLVNSLYIGVNRLRVMRIGPLVYYEDPPLQKIQNTTFFEGLSSGKILQEMIDEVDSIVQKDWNQKFFFGPRIEFFYALFRLPSPEHLPVWWHGGTSYPLSLIPTLAESWNSHKFDVLIFPKNDIFVFTDAKFGQYPFFPDAIKDSIHNDYQIDHISFRHISVAYRKSGSRTSISSFGYNHEVTSRTFLFSLNRSSFINNNPIGSNTRSFTQ